MVSFVTAATVTGPTTAREAAGAAAYTQEIKHLAEA